MSRARASLARPCRGRIPLLIVIAAIRANAMHTAPTLDRGGPSHKLRFIGEARIRGPPSWSYALLTMTFIGMQLIWTTEMGLAAPYLLKLGLSRSAISIALMAGPLSGAWVREALWTDAAGLIVQPIVGTLSDSCRLPIGRRRPFIIAGGAVCVISLLLFGYCTDVAAVFARRGGSAHANLAIVLAVLAVWLIDFSVNVVRRSQGSKRAESRRSKPPIGR